MNQTDDVGDNKLFRACQIGDFLILFLAPCNIFLFSHVLMHLSLAIFG